MEKSEWPKISATLPRTQADWSVAAGPGGLAEVDDADTGRRRGERALERLAPERVDDQRRGRQLAARGQVEDLVGRGGDQSVRRAAPITRSAPSSFAPWTATAAERAARAEHEHGVVGARRARATRRRASAVSPAIPQASAVASSTPSGISNTQPPAGSASSAISRGCGRAPRRRRPSRVPTASEPITYGVGGVPP